MTFMTDRRIKALCTKPNFMISVYTGIMSPLRFRERLVYDSEENLKRLMAANVIRGYHPVSDEDLVGWSPMIEPFFDTQQREVKRPMTEFEEELYQVGGFEYLSEKLLKAGKRLDLSPARNGESRNDVIAERAISFGLTSRGYDVRLADDFKIFHNANGGVIDPKNFDENCYMPYTGSFCIIPPNSFILGRTVERFNIPRDVVATCIGKSTYARTGCIVNVTPLEPEWTGYLTLELSNTTPLPMKVYANEGIAQIMFDLGEDCEVSYADRKGKYMDQGAEATPPKM